MSDLRTALKVGAVLPSAVGTKHDQLHTPVTSGTQMNEHLVNNLSWTAACLHQLGRRLLNS